MPDEIAIHFGTLGYPLPMNTNPTDHMMAILSIDEIRIKANENGENLSPKEIEDRYY